MIQTLETLIRSYGPWGFFLSILIEEIIVPLPSSLITLAGGFFLVRASTWSEAVQQIFPGLVLLGALGISLGSLFFYLLSYYGGELAIKRIGPKLGFSLAEIEKTQEYFQKNYLDETALLILRALPVFPGVAINVAAGLIKMPILNFIFFGFLGSGLRVFLMTLLGWQLKEASLSLAWQLEKISSALFLIFLGIFAILMLFWLRKEMKGLVKKLIKKLLPERVYNTWVAYLWHLPKAILANLFYRFPAKRLRVIGVAGTKGKSTSCYLISQLLESQGKKTALISTTTIKLGEKEKLNDLKMTSADSWYLQKFLAQAVKENCDFVVLETSSHALKQFRTWGIDFEVVALTNLTPDHQEYHFTPEDYILSHRRMISRKTRRLILNADDSYLEPFRKLPVEKISFGLEQPSDLKILQVEAEKDGSKIKLSQKNTQVEFQFPLPGKFNLYNLLTALAVLYGLGFELTQLGVPVSRLRPAPGRVEKIPNHLGIEIIVDYAHSPESFENFFSAIKPYVKKRLLAVIGACGERDASKRPIMGEILSRYCDYVIVTNDDPFGEEPEKIARELSQGITIDYEKILDRRQAIERAIKLAQKDDTLVVLGKGAEQWQVFKDKKIPWDDRKVIKEILNSLSQ